MTNCAWGIPDTILVEPTGEPRQGRFDGYRNPHAGFGGDETGDPKAREAREVLKRVDFEKIAPDPVEGRNRDKAD